MASLVVSLRRRCGRQAAEGGLYFTVRDVDKMHDIVRLVEGFVYAIKAAALELDDGAVV